MIKIGVRNRKATRCNRAVAKVGRCQQKLYKEIQSNLNKWFRSYNEYKNSSKVFLTMATLKKYRLIKKSLQKDFENDAGMARHIRRLPNIWILMPYAVEIMLLLSMFGVQFINQRYLKIFTGVLLRFRGGEFDAIYFFTSILFVFIYILLFHKRVETHNALIENLSQIWYIVEKKTPYNRALAGADLQSVPTSSKAEVSKKKN